MHDSYRRTNEGTPQVIAGSTAGASGGGDHGSLVYSKSELGELATQLSSIEDWLRDSCTARHNEDMADVVHKAWQVVEDLYDEMEG